jgi:aryl-alcohol dehydrogenase-like predicted oxidoreductase
MNLNMGYSEAPAAADARDLLEFAVELGITLFDTAEVYGPFTNEELIGGALRKVRDRVVIATKFGFEIPYERGRPQGVNSRPEHIRAVCDASLQRLGVETIDLFYQHRVDPAVPIEDVAGTVGELVARGKVRYFGLSEAGPDTIRRAHRVHPVSALQTEYSLWSRDPEVELLPLCRTLGIGFVAYSPLGRGFLAGAAQDLNDRDYRRSQPRWQGEALAENLTLYERFAALAAAKSCTTAQLALAWLLHQGVDIVPIPGTNKRHRLQENVAAALIRLSAAELAVIETAVPAGLVKGARYDAAGAALLPH